MKTTYYFQYKIKAKSNREWLGETGQASRRESWNSDKERGLGQADDDRMGRGDQPGDRGIARGLLGKSKRRVDKRPSGEG